VEEGAEILIPLVLVVVLAAVLLVVADARLEVEVPVKVTLEALVLTVVDLHGAEVVEVLVVLVQQVPLLVTAVLALPLVLLALVLLGLEVVVEVLIQGLGVLQLPEVVTELMVRQVVLMVVRIQAEAVEVGLNGKWGLLEVGVVLEL
jgi:hypothetical protein